MNTTINKTKLAVFDFDGTLISTPLPEQGREFYETKTGNEWPHQGWWGQADSLDIDIFDMPVIESVIVDYQREKANPNTLIILLTGRISKLEPQVRKVLASKNLSFDEYHYNTGGSTDQVKLKTLDRLLVENPNIQEVELWDDSQSHIPIFEQWGKNNCLSGRLKDFKINVVIGNHH